MSRAAVVADHVMVKLRPDATEAGFLKMIEETGLKVRKKFPASGMFLIAAQEADLDTADRLVRLLGQGTVQVTGVELDSVVEALETLPGNTRFTEQWALHNTGQTGGTADADIDAPEAWSIATGNHQIVVGVIDTGIDYNHPDLAANIWQNPGEVDGDGIDNDGNGYIDDVHGYDFFSDDGNPMDEGSHGTHVSGTIGAAAGSAGNVAGVCWNVSMMGLRFLGPNGGFISDAIDAVAYSVQNGVNLTSNSWGGGGYSALLEAEIQNAGNHGMLFVAAAGNDGWDTDTNPQYPGAYTCDNIISVAATDHNDGMAYFSNFGATSVDIAAPGVNILSTYPGHSYASFSGTSMACPHVTGACALLLGINPGMNPAQVKALILGSADPIASQAGKSVTGGRLNLFKAAVMADPNPHLVVTGTTIQDSSGNQDGIANPGETISIAIHVANVGPVGTSQVTATLSKTDNNSAITLLNSGITVGNLPGNGGIAPPQQFTARIESTPTPHPVSLIVTLRDSAGQSWTHPFTLTIHHSVVVSGYVWELGSSSQGISNATVIYSGPRQGSLTTNPAGFYQFTAIDGDYQLTASAPGFASEGPVTLTISPPGTQITRNFRLGKPDLEVDTAEIQLTANVGETMNGTITLRNAGNAPLHHTVLGGQLAMQPGQGTLWHKNTNRTTSGTGSWHYGIETTGDYETGAPNAGALTSSTIRVPSENAVLNFDEWLDSESHSDYDIALLQISTDGGISWTNVVRSSPTNGSWASRSVDLSNHAGQAVHLRFHFDTVDAAYNDFEGWYVDRLRFGDRGIIETLNQGEPLQPNAAISIHYSIDTTTLYPGVHRDRIEISSNDPDEPLVTIPVSIRVEVPGLALYESQASGQIQLPMTGATRGPANPYPSVIPVSGVNGTLAGIRVKIDRLSHTYPSDLDIMLEGPQGQKILLMSAAGGSLDADAVSFDFVHGNSAPRIDYALVAGSYTPTVIYSRGDMPGAPQGPYAETLDVLLGTDPNGVWKLHAYDSAYADVGAVESWKLEFLVAENTNTFNSWVMTRFGYGSEQAADDKDPDQDGIANLVEYALGLDPRLAMPGGTPELLPISNGGAAGASANTPRHLTLAVSRSSRRADLDYIVEVSRDLQTWNHGDGHTVIASDTETRLEVRDARQIGDFPSTFMRLRVERR